MDLVASFLSSDGKKLQEILEAVNLFDRSEKLLILLKEELELSKLQQDIQKQIEEKVSQNQREFFLREQLKVIKKELGLEKDDKTTEVEAIEKKIKPLNGANYQGDPAAALLEVLDPEQNSEFLDHYLDVRFDLSNILFVTTANQLDTIPRPLLDRMEIIKLSGYILEEKVEIAKSYLVPKQRKEHGLKANEVSISGAALKKMIDGYAREAGIRGLENQIKKIMRKVTLRQAEGGNEKIAINSKNFTEYLGQPIFTTEELYKKLLQLWNVGAIKCITNKSKRLMQRIAFNINHKL